jgi:hypothetical protein
MPGLRDKMPNCVCFVAVGAVLFVACAPGAGEPVSAPSASSGAESTVDSKPRPNADLAGELVRYYPLRGLVLSEGGSARVRFTVSASGTVSTGDTISSTREEYAEACRQMLRASTWAPAHKNGRPVEFSSVFDCRFEHGAELTARGTVGTQAAVPAEPPDYGKLWYERYGEDYVTHDTSAQLRIALDPRGAVRVLAAAPGSDPSVVQACSEMLQQGPAWTPAKDAAGRAVAVEVDFACRVELRSKRKELHVNAVGSSGPISPALVSAALADHFPAFVRCYETAFGLGKPLQGLHWLAFEITPAGEVGRVEWIERAYSDEAIDACVQRAARGMRFGPAAERTIADAQLYIGGLGAMVNDLPTNNSPSMPHTPAAR